MPNRCSQTAASRIENYPELKAQIEHHLEQTRRQAESLRRCIERHDSSTSMFKDTAAKVMGFGQALTGLTVSDEVVKASAASYAFEQMEIATYTVLIVAAEECGDWKPSASASRFWMRKRRWRIGSTSICPRSPHLSRA